MIQKDLVLDFDLYLCERFGYRNSIHATDTQNGFCACVREREVKLYIRFWEYSNGMNGFPDWCIILVDCQFSKRQEEELKELVRFLKEYAPRYGYKYIGIENNHKLNEVLMLPQMRSTKEDNYVVALIYTATR